MVCCLACLSYDSSVRGVQQIMQDTSLELVRVGDTRWTSSYRTLTAIVLNLQAIVVTLQELHADSGDLSSEAGGLLLTFQDGTRTAQLFALAEILQPLHTLTLILQSKKLTLAEFPLKVEMAVTRLQQICEDSSTIVHMLLNTTNLLQHLGFHFLERL